jgi:predicted kinase
MRKWIGERLKRRKKTTEESKNEPKEAPLQPAYFDAAAPPAAPEAKEAESTKEAVDSTDVPATEQARPPVAADTGDARRSNRRRRGRGGRGRRGTPAQRLPASPEEGSAFRGDTSSAVAAVPQVPAGDIATTPAVPKGVVVLAIGLPGSGKSSWFKRHNITPLSSDMLRALLFDDPTEQRFQDLVFSNLRSMLKARLIARRPMNYVDATNLTSHDRLSWIKLAHNFGYEVQAVYFDVPLEVCLERNQKRQRLVEEDVLRRMAGKLKAPTFEEGFTKITVVKVKPKE